MVRLWMLAKVRWSESANTIWNASRYAIPLKVNRSNNNITKSKHKRENCFSVCLWHFLCEHVLCVGIPVKLSHLLLQISMCSMQHECFHCFLKTVIQSSRICFTFVGIFYSFVGIITFFTMLNKQLTTGE